MKAKLSSLDSSRLDVTRVRSAGVLEEVLSPAFSL